MCDVLNLEVEIPKKSLEMAIPAINDFLRDPSDWNLFASLDVVLRIVLGPKWSYYSAARYVSAAREDRNADHDEIVDLQG